MLTLTSCSQGDDKMKIIPYGTPEFNEFVKKSPISLDEAWNIYINYYEKKLKKDNNYNYIDNIKLYYILDGHYIFTDNADKYNKQGDAYLLSGIWVNANNGDVFEKFVNKRFNVLDIKPWSKN